MKRASLALMLALAPAVGWAQLPPSPPIRSEPLPPPNMQVPPARPGVGQPQQLQPPSDQTQPEQLPPEQPPSDQTPPEQLPPEQPPSDETQPEQLPPEQPPSDETQPEQPPLEQPPPEQQPEQPQQRSGQPAAPDYAPGVTGQPAPLTSAPAPPNEWIPQGGAIVQVLDKVNATTAILHVRVGESVAYGSLRIEVLACQIRPPNMRTDAAASLVIKDTNPDQPGFRGWMLQNEPYLSMLQNPSYDVRIEGCTP